MRKLVPILVLLIIAAAVYFFVRSTREERAPDQAQSQVDERDEEGRTVLGRAYKRSDSKIHEIYSTHDDDIANAIDGN